MPDLEVYMHARVATITLHRDKIDECIRIFRSSIMPEAKKQKGFSDLLLLTDRANGNCIVLSLWNSETDLKASETGGYYTAQVTKLQPLLVGQPTREHCTVTVHELSALKGGMLHGRMTTAMFQHGKIDEGTRIIRDSILPEAKKQKGYEGLVSVVDRDTGKGYTLSCWDSGADLKAGETSGYYKAQIAKLQPLLIGQPARESYEVTLPAMAPTPMQMGTQPQPPAP
jgi:heme-degrading monooxygenase HmoA